MHMDHTYEEERRLREVRETVQMIAFAMEIVALIKKPRKREDKDDPSGSSLGSKVRFLGLLGNLLFCFCNKI